MPIHIDPDQIQQIAAACQRSSETIQTEASTMRTQMEQLQEALAGFPHLAMADRFQEWNSLFSQLSTALADSNSYLNSVVASVNEFVAQLGRQ